RKVAPLDLVAAGIGDVAQQCAEEERNRSGEHEGMQGVDRVDRPRTCHVVNSHGHRVRLLIVGGAPEERPNSSYRRGLRRRFLTGSGIAQRRTSAGAQETRPAGYRKPSSAPSHCTPGRKDGVVSEGGRKWLSGTPSSRHSSPFSNN